MEFALHEQGDSDGDQPQGPGNVRDEYRVARAWRDALVTKIWAGRNEIMKEIIGRSLDLGAPR